MPQQEGSVKIVDLLYQLDCNIQRLKLDLDELRFWAPTSLLALEPKQDKVAKKEAFGRASDAAFRVERIRQDIGDLALLLAPKKPTDAAALEKPAAAEAAK